MHEYSYIDSFYVHQAQAPDALNLSLNEKKSLYYNYNHYYSKKDFFKSFLRVDKYVNRSGSNW